MHHAMSSERSLLSTCIPDQLPWVPWAMKGAWFRLLHADPASGRFTLLIRLEPGTDLPAHRHVGAVEGLVLEGGFHYREAPDISFTVGTYLYEADGAVHQPVSANGAILFAVFHGPVEALSRKGRCIGRIDCAWHVNAWQMHAAHSEALTVPGAPALFR